MGIFIQSLPSVIGKGARALTHLYLEAKGIRRIHGAGSEYGPSIRLWLKSSMRTRGQEVNSQKEDDPSFLF